MSLLCFEQVAPSYPELATVIALSIGSPTPERVQKVLGLYDAPSHYLIGSFQDNKLIGVIGFEIQGATGIIKHIAVSSAYWLKGVGKALIRQVIDCFSLQSICTETDDDAVDFYKKCGFTCQPFEGYYGKRYKCECKL